MLVCELLHSSLRTCDDAYESSVCSWEVGKSLGYEALKDKQKVVLEEILKKQNVFAILLTRFFQLSKRCLEEA